jgi:hypothetical protein
MIVTPMLLGFSARATRTERNERVCRRQLLRPDLAWPLSTDYMVWPTVFEVADDNACASARSGSSLQDLWGSLDELKAAMAAELTPADWPEGSYQIIAVARMFIDHSGPLTWPGHPDAFRGPIDPPEIDEAWEFLGYDVSDNWILSGLSNCLSNDDPDFAKWEEWFAPMLNDHGLFAEIDNAVEFTGAIDEKVKEHAPFAPHGIWRVS